MRHISGTFAAAYRCCIMYMSLNWVNIAKNPCNGKIGSILLLYVDAEWNIELNWVKIAKNSCNIKIGSILLEYIHIFGKFERRFIWHPFIFPNYWWKSCPPLHPFDILSFHGGKNPQIFVLHTWKSSNFFKILPQYFWACKAKKYDEIFSFILRDFLIESEAFKVLTKYAWKKREKKKISFGRE